MTSLWGPGCATFDINLPGVTSGDIRSAEYFSVAILTLMALFVFQKIASLFESKRIRMTMAWRMLMSPLRIFRSWTLGNLPGFTSKGHCLVVSLYISINIILLFTMLEWPLPLLSHFARRLGWLAVANISLLFFLALKNTPLAYLTAYSYERLNELHQIAGWTTIALAVLHTIVFIVARAQENELCNIVDIPQHLGMIATIAMLIILATSLFLKSWKYEAWYIIHVIMACLVLFGVGFHRPDFSTYSVRAIIFTAGIFVTDLVIRWTRLILNKRHQTAILYPLPNGGVGVVFSHPLAQAVPGKHVRLLIRKLKFSQTHPFTIVSANPVKIVFGAKNGFTRKMYELAVEAPGKALKATLDGPYGTLPRFHKFDRVLLFAGGTGASFTFSIAVELLKQKPLSANFVLEFVWSFRHPVRLEWYKDELEILHNSPLTRLSLHCTSTLENVSEEKSSPKLEPQAGSGERVNPELHSALIPGRANISAIVRGAVANTRQEQRIIVAACGPVSLLKEARRATAECVRVSGPSIEFYTESYG